jgi:hypothetical protein
MFPRSFANILCKFLQELAHAVLFYGHREFSILKKLFDKKEVKSDF